MRSCVLQSTNYCELDWGRCILWGKGDMKDTHIEPSFHTRARLQLWSCVSKNGQSQGSGQGWTSTHQSPREDRRVGGWEKLLHLVFGLAILLFDVPFTCLLPILKYVKNFDKIPGSNVFFQEYTRCHNGTSL